MIHNVRLIQRHLEGKSNAMFRPYILISLVMLAVGTFVLLNSN